MISLAADLQFSPKGIMEAAILGKQSRGMRPASRTARPAPRPRASCANSTRRGSNRGQPVQPRPGKPAAAARHPSTARPPASWRRAELGRKVVRLAGQHHRAVALPYHQRLVPGGVARGRDHATRPARARPRRRVPGSARRGSRPARGSCSPAARAVASSVRCTTTGRPANSGLPPQWSKCRWQLTTRSISPASRRPGQRTSSGRRRGR